MTKQEQLHIGLIVCQAVLEALIRTHPDKASLKRELSAQFETREVAAVTEDGLGEQEQAHLKASIDAFLWQLNDQRA